MKSKERDQYLLLKIIQYCQDVEKAHEVFNNNQDLFCDKDQGRVYRNAVAMPILQIGELAKNLSDEFLKINSDISWKLIIKTRDFFAHHYGNLTPQWLWDTSHKDIKELKEYLLKIK